MKKRRLSILLSIVMLFSLLPTTALAAAYDSVKVNDILLNNGSYLESNSSTSAETGANTEPLSYVAWYKGGVLTLNGYNGKGIEVQGLGVGDLTIKLIGDNTITPYTTGIQGNSKSGSITITADSGRRGTLTIDVTNQTQSVYGIDGDGNSVTITGSANVTINAEAKNAGQNSYGIKSEAAVSILGSASVNIISKTPNSTRTNACYGIYNNDAVVAIDTEGTIQIDVSGAGTAATAASWGVNSNRDLTLTKVGGMTVKWKNKDEGGPLYPKREFNPAEYDKIVDETTCTATYMPKVATPTATVGDVTITGTTDTAITEKDVVITLTNDKFHAITANTDVNGWFTNLPAGLEAKIKTAVNDKDTTATIEISGNPSATSSEPLAIKIPEANLVTSASDLDVTSNANAVFAITTPITEGLVPVDGLTGKTYNGLAQEPSFSGTLTRGTDYTVSYAVKSGSTGNLDSDNKPVGAGTYVVTVTGKGSYTGSFDKEFKIDKANPDYTAPTAKTGLAYTGSELNLINAGTVTKGGTIQYRLNSGSYSTTIPTATDAGNYTVHFKIDENDNYNAVAEMQVGTGAINIAPADQSAPTSLSVAAPTASGDNGKITGTTTAMEYSTDSGFTSPTDCSDTATEVAPGTYYVRFKADANHNAGAVSAALVVPAYSATKYNVTVMSDANGTASADKTADVVAGETVTLTATPKSGYVFDEWTDKTPTSLLIGADGKFTMPSGNVSVKATFKGAALTGTASITGTLKFNEKLTASLAGGNNTGTLFYKWYRGSDEIIGATDSTYTLVAEDIGESITVKVSSSVQTGEITSAATAAVGKADGPAAPTAFTLGFTLNSDGKTFTATISTVPGGEYSFDGVNYSETNTKDNCTANTSYTGYVRIKETATHKTGTEIRNTQTSPKLTVATPTFMPNGASSFSGTQNVTINCDTADAKIYYTTDGKDPKSAGTLYTTALTLTSTTTLKAIAVKADMNDSEIATATFTKYSGGSGGSGGGYVPTVQKPEITIIGSGKADLSADGRTATITAAAGHELVSVVLNGKEMGKVEKLTGLKTGDKATITFRAKADGKAEMDKMIAQKASKLKLMARSVKTAKKNIKVVVKGDLKAITDAGYTVKYKFYRSTKKSAGYKAVLTKKAPTYYNTYGKKGTMYYYKARVMIYDKEGKFVAQTALKQCKYANRLWTK